MQNDPENRVFQVLINHGLETWWMTEITAAGDMAAASLGVAALREQREDIAADFRTMRRLIIVVIDPQTVIQTRFHMVRVPGSPGLNALVVRRTEQRQPSTIPILVNADISQAVRYKPAGAKKAHYFIQRQSICGEFAFMHFSASSHQTTDPEVEDCRACLYRMTPKSQQKRPIKVWRQRA